MAWREVANGRIENGHLLIRNIRKLESRLARHRDGDVVVTIEKLYARRSKAQNDYYWGVVVPRIQAAFLRRGVIPHDDPKLVHDILKSQFMDPELVRTGRIRGYISDTGLTIGTSTTDLNTLEFIEYLERIADHAATSWETYIPPPDPNWREHAEREAEMETARPAAVAAGEMESEW